MSGAVLFMGRLPPPNTPAPAGVCPDSSRLPGLDGLRAVAIGLVLACHGSTSAAARLGMPLTGWLRLALVFKLGNEGVALFFAISGYLITRLLARELKVNGRIWLFGFYVRRCLRILPAYGGYLAVVGLLAIAGIVRIRGGDFAAAGSFLWNYLGSGRNDSELLGHTWSLAVEEQFYVVWPLALCLLGLRRARAAAAILVVLSPMLRVALYFAIPSSRPFMGGQIHTCADRLLFGCLLALCEGEPWLDSALSHVRSALWPTLVFAFLVAAQPSLEYRFGGAYLLPFGFSLDALGWTFVIAWVLRNRDSVLSRLLALHPVRKVGTLSYSLYLWQQPFTSSVNTTFTSRFPLNLVCATLAACASYFLIERIFLARKAGFEVRPAAMQLPAAVPGMPGTSTPA